MSYELDAMHAQMNRLERQLRILKIAAVVLRSAGGDHGACVSAGGAAGQRHVGLRINDANGAERFGAAFMNDGNMVLGLDAPLGTGNGVSGEEVLRPQQ